MATGFFRVSRFRTRRAALRQGTREMLPVQADQLYRNFEDTSYSPGGVTKAFAAMIKIGEAAAEYRNTHAKLFSPGDAKYGHACLELVNNPNALAGIGGPQNQVQGLLLEAGLLLGGLRADALMLGDAQARRDAFLEEGQAARRPREGADLLARHNAALEMLGDTVHQEPGAGSMGPGAAGAAGAAAATTVEMEIPSAPPAPSASTPASSASTTSAASSLPVNSANSASSATPASAASSARSANSAAPTSTTNASAATAAAATPAGASPGAAPELATRAAIQQFGETALNVGDREEQAEDAEDEEWLETAGSAAEELSRLSQASAALRERMEAMKLEFERIAEEVQARVSRERELAVESFRRAVGDAGGEEAEDEAVDGGAEGDDTDREDGDDSDSSNDSDGNGGSGNSTDGVEGAEDAGASNISSTSVNIEDGDEGEKDKEGDGEGLEEAGEAGEAAGEAGAEANGDDDDADGFGGASRLRSGAGCDAPGTGDESADRAIEGTDQ